MLRLSLRRVWSVGAKGRAQIRSMTVINNKYFNNDDKANDITTIDRLLKIKPAINEEEDQFDYEGLPEMSEFTEEGDPDPKIRLSKTILSLGRVLYRHISNLPPWFIEKQQEICNNRTPAQIRRCLKDWMIKYDREAAEKYVQRPLIFGDKAPQVDKQKAQAYGPEETVAYANYYMPSRFSITTRVMKEMQTLCPDFQPKRILDFGCGPGTAGAAAFHVWGAENTAKYIGIDMSQSMIDAAKIMTRDTIADCLFWDKSGEVIKRAETRNERYDMSIISYSLSDFANDPVRRAAVQIMFELLDVGGYLVLIDHGNPKGSNMCRSARQLVIDLFNNVDETGKAVNLPTSYYLPTEAELRAKEQREEEVREREEEGEGGGRKGGGAAAAEKKMKPTMTKLILPAPLGYKHNELGAYVVAPCTHDRVCPLGSGSWCSFSQKVYGGMIRKDSEEKFSYVVIQKRPKPVPAAVVVDGARASKVRKSKKDDEAFTPALAVKAAPESYGNWTSKAALGESANTINKNYNSNEKVDAQRQQPTPLQVLERFVGVEEEDVPDLVDQLLEEVDWEEYKPPLYREEYGRVVRAPLKNKGHITVDLCHPGGDLHRNTLSRANLLGVPALYSALRKTTWGGLFPVLAEQKERSPLSRKVKGNRGAPAPFRKSISLVGQSSAEMVDEGMTEEDADDEDAAAMTKKKKGKGGPKHTVEEFTKRLTPAEELAAAKRDLQRKQNHFTGRPLNSKTFYPKIEVADAEEEKLLERRSTHKKLNILPPKANPLSVARGQMNKKDKGEEKDADDEEPEERSQQRQQHPRTSMLERMAGARKKRLASAAAAASNVGNV